MKWIRNFLIALGAGFVISEGDEILELISFQDSFSSLFDGINSGLFPLILSFFKAFLCNPTKGFSYIGSEISSSFSFNNFEFFSDNFVFIVIGILIGIMILKFMIKFTSELISKLIDVT